MIRISSDKMEHSIGVARIMYSMSKKKGWSEEKAQEMFMLGYLHDVGYEFSLSQSEHANIGGELLKNQGYKYWKEIYYHGLITDEYKSDELNLLNIADFSIDSKGNQVNTNQRLEDISKRYGEDSIQYKSAVELAIKIGLL